MQRSVWAWGWAERFPSREARLDLGRQAALILGMGDVEVREAAEPVIPAPRIACDLPFASADPHERALHTRGRGWPDLVRGFHGDFRSAPDVVLRPRTEGEVEAALAWADAARAAVIPFGGGTGVVGGVEFDGAGYAGVASLDLAALDRVLEVDPLSRAARIQAGATGPILEEQLGAHGLTLRHFPQSFEHSTLGGWIATRAGGHFATLYTHIDDLVESVRMLTPTGWWASPRLPASGAGPAPDRLVLGSEGTLGVITEAWMRVFERPTFRASASVRFTAFESAVTAARRIAQAGLYPANCRVLDAREAMLHQVTYDGSCVLLLAFESAHHPVDAWLELAVGIAREAGGIGDAARAAGAWKEAFFEAPYRQSALLTCGLLADTFETATTWDRFAALHDDVIRSVKAALGPPSIVSCRFTHVYPDGPAPYYTFLAPDRGDPIGRWTEAKTAASEALVRHGATITHHHAVGRRHRPWYDRERPERFAAALRAAKGAVDPAWMLNPGVLVDR
jgi:alkyldihydroxyacetonephosphate synthase